MVGMSRAISQLDVTVDGECLSILSHKQGIGLMFIAQAGLISTVAVTILLLLVLAKYIKNVVNPPPGKWKLIRTHVDAYLLSLLFAELLQGIGAVLSLKWAIEEKSYCSAYCTAQGLIQHLGETGVALGTLIIGLHTFLTVFFHFKPPRLAWIGVIVAQWSFLGLYIVIAYVRTKGPVPYYAPTPFWCWISSEHDPDRVFAEYLWMWLAAFSNIALYIPLFFLLRGNIHVNSVTRKITFNFNLKESFGGCFGRRKAKSQDWGMMGAPVGRGGHGTTSDSTTASNGNEKEALKLIWYPISYTAVILPISIARWSSSFLDPQNNTPVNELPVTKTAVTTFIFGLSGLVNVLVFMLTRPHLLLFGPRRGMVGDPPRRLTSNFGAPPRSTIPSTVIDPSQSSEWLPKSSELTGHEPPRYIASLPSSPNPTAKTGNFSTQGSRSTNVSREYEYPPPGFGRRRESRGSDAGVDDDDASDKKKDGGSFLSLHPQCAGEYGDLRDSGRLTRKDSLKDASDEKGERLGSSWVAVPEMARSQGGSADCFRGGVVVGVEVVVSTDRDQYPDTPVWHAPSRPI